MNKIKLFGLDGVVFRNYYRESPKVFDIIDKHIHSSTHDAPQDLFYLALKDCLLTYSTKTGYVSIHLVDENGNDEFIMNLKPENFREAVIK